MCHNIVRRGSLLVKSTNLAPGWWFKPKGTSTRRQVCPRAILMMTYWHVATMDRTCHLGLWVMTRNDQEFGFSAQEYLCYSTATTALGVTASIQCLRNSPLVTRSRFCPTDRTSLNFMTSNLKLWLQSTPSTRYTSSTCISSIAESLFVDQSIAVQVLVLLRLS